VAGLGLRHTPSVEVYIPWNDTWAPLPDLPMFTAPGGTELRMVNTQIFPLQQEGSMSLYILGGSGDDWTTSATGKVWSLKWSPGTQYSWVKTQPQLGEHIMHLVTVGLIINLSRRGLSKYFTDSWSSGHLLLVFLNLTVSIHWVCTMQPENKSVPPIV
jgi:hypothetical protein